MKGKNKMDINQTTLLGNVSSEPEFRKTNRGDSVVNFRLITNERYQDKNTGDVVDKKQSTNVVFWKPPEFMEKALVKGARVLLNNGKLQTVSWENEKKEKQYKTEVLVGNGQGEVIILNNSGKEEE